MREIKFRAWHLDGTGFHTMHEWSQVKHSFNLYLEDSKVMQFTGLTDKNGVEIYEGDKLYLHHDDGEGNYAGVVEWLADGDWLGWGLMIQGTPDELLVDNQEFLEVIGNIYENPELPEAGK